MKWTRALSAWFAVMSLESVSGTLRRLYLVPVAGELRSHQIGMTVGCIIIFTVTWLAIDWIGSRSFRMQLKVGALWVFLTILFESGLGLLFGYSPDRIIADYDLSRGGLMGIGLLFLLFAPALAASLRHHLRYRKPG
ncbi:MAG: hypothetical protein HGB00_03280 [Chlorobiaceae bacterium]|nr:hypothetical protein [Chlorobiaceae bacterium]